MNSKCYWSLFSFAHIEAFRVYIVECMYSTSQIFIFPLSRNMLMRGEELIALFMYFLPAILPTLSTIQTNGLRSGTPWTGAQAKALQQLQCSCEQLHNECEEIFVRLLFFKKKKKSFR